MNQNELLDALSQATESTKADAKRFLDAIGTVIGKELKATGSIKVPGLGTFTVTKRDARPGRNPRTGETIQIAASTGVKFKATPTFLGDL